MRSRTDQAQRLLNFHVARKASETQWPTRHPNPPGACGGRSRSTRRDSPVRLPTQPVSVDELELKAKSVLKTEAFDYVAGGAGSEETMRANRDAFRRWRIVPRFLRDVSQRDLGVDVLGLKLRAPVMLAPIGVQGILHKEGELAVARAARVARRADDPEHGLVLPDGSGGRRPGRYAALVSALLAAGRRAGGQLHSPRRAGRLRRDRGDARHLLAGLARA